MDNILQTVWMILKNTPWWVYVIFFYCVFVGIKCSKDGVTSIYKMLIIPAVFLYLSLETLYLNFKLDVMVVAVYAAALLGGTLLGALQGKLQGVSVDKEKKLVAVPGTWATLVIIFVIFFSKYYFGYALGMDPGLATNTHFEIAMLIVSGGTVGLFVGRTLYYFIRMQSGPWVKLVEDD